MPIEAAPPPPAPRHPIKSQAKGVRESRNPINALRWLARICQSVLSGLRTEEWDCQRSCASVPPPCSVATSIASRTVRVTLLHCRLFLSDGGRHREKGYREILHLKYPRYELVKCNQFGPKVRGYITITEPLFNRRVFRSGRTSSVILVADRHCR